MTNNLYPTLCSYLATSYFFSILMITGLISAFWERHKFLLSLLSLELTVLGLFGGLMFFLSQTGTPMAISLFLLVLGACEASLGLSLLVSLTRMTGSDMLNQTTTLKC